MAIDQKGLAKRGPLAALAAALLFAVSWSAAASAQPIPLASAATPAKWWFAFKCNAAEFPTQPPADCMFGGSPKPYKAGESQSYMVATSDHPALQDGGVSLLGTSTADPVGATFGEIFQSHLNYVVWNDQFYRSPNISGCSDSCGAPWGHSKGVVAWDDNGDGLVMQVTTPSWPAAGGADNPRTGDGNTLGCVSDDDVEVSQHFFALALSHDDLVAVLKALANASVVTNPGLPQLVHNGGPQDVQALVSALGQKSSSKAVITAQLSSGVLLISKPSALHVPPWQLVSAVLGGVPLRTATWWAAPKIPSTTDTAKIACWDASLPQPGAVEVATTGQWDGKALGLTGGMGKDHNHGKVGVATDGVHPLAIFGDMNQQGAIAGNCASSQNGRGGMFFVVDNPDLAASVSSLIRATRRRPPARNSQSN